MGEIDGGPVVQDFTMHAVEIPGNEIAVSLRCFSHTLTLGEIAANEAVGVFIGATFTRRVQVAVVEAGGQ